MFIIFIYNFNHFYVILIVSTQLKYNDCLEFRRSQVSITKLTFSKNTGNNGMEFGRTYVYKIHVSVIEAVYVRPVLSGCVHLRFSARFVSVPRGAKASQRYADKRGRVREMERRGGRGREGETIKKKRLKRAKVSDEIASTLETCSLKRSDSRMHEIRLRAETVSFWVDGDGGGLPS